MDRYCFFADYEIHMGDRFRVCGQTTLVHQVAEGTDLDPAEVLTKIRQKAADTHGVDCTDVRVRALNRL